MRTFLFRSRFPRDMAGKPDFENDDARESWDRLSEWGGLEIGPGNDGLTKLGMEYFGYAAERLRKEGTPLIPYFMPEISQIEHINLQDIKTLIEIAQDSRLMEVFEEAKGSNRLIAAPKSIFSEDELWELSVIMRKWPLDILGAYDGKELVLKKGAGLWDLGHELNHVLRHQSIGTFEIPARHRNRSAATRSNAPLYIIEFFGELEEIINDNVGGRKRYIPGDTKYKATAEGLERAVQYFAPSYLGKAREIVTYLIQGLSHLADDAPSESEATKESARGFSKAVNRATEELCSSTDKFEVHGKYAVLIEDADVRAVGSAISIAGHLILSLGRYSYWLNEYEPSGHIKKIRYRIGAAISTLQQFRANLDREIETQPILIPPIYNSSIPYVLADIAISKRFEDLRINWPQAFFMPAAQVGEIYFKDIIAGARKARADYLKAKAEVAPSITLGRI